MGALRPFGPLARAAVVASALAVSAGAGRAEPAPPGLVLGIAPGSGYADLSFDDQNEIGVASSLRLGWAIRPRVVLGFETGVWWRKKQGVTTTARLDGFAFTWFPGATSGGYVHAVAGIGTLRAKGGRVSAEDSGAGASLGVGYEMRVSPRFGLGPQVDAGWMDVEGADFKQVAGSLAMRIYFGG